MKRIFSVAYRLARGPSSPARGASMRGLLLGVGLALTWQSRVEASQTFPAELAKALNMQCVPACTLCHLDNNGGAATITQKFGQFMMLNGLQGRKPETIASVVQTARMKMQDSDADAIGDLDELSQGRDPNVVGALSVCSPEYGCAVYVPSRPRKDSRGPIALFLLGLGAVGFVRRTTRQHDAA